MPNYNQLLMEARRRALIGGRPLTQQETAGIAEGASRQASERAARAKTAKLAEERLTLDERRVEQEKMLALKQMRQREKEFKAQQEAYAEQQRRQASGSVISGAAAGAMAGSYAGAPGMAIGAAVGALAGYFGGGGGSHICTATNYYAGLSKGIPESMDMLMQFCKKHRKKLLCYYVNTAGPSLIRHIKSRYTEEKLVKYYKKIHKKMLVPIHNLVQSGQLDEAADLYSEKTLELLKKYQSMHAMYFERLMKDE